MSRRILRLTAALAAAGVLAAGGGAVATAGSGGSGHRHADFTATLIGYEEVPAISTAASGTFDARLDRKHDKLHWKLTYADLEADATQAHIHFGQTAVNGGISVWLCGNVAGTPPGVQRCPARSATLTGTADADDVVGPAEQGIAPGEFDELIAAMDAGVTYANVHSRMFPNGEIRGQIAPDDDRKHD